MDHARGVTELYFVVRLESRFLGAHDVLDPGSRLITLPLRLKNRACHAPHNLVR